jgi:hypothetical protein
MLSSTQPMSRGLMQATCSRVTWMRAGNKRFPRVNLLALKTYSSIADSETVTGAGKLGSRPPSVFTIGKMVPPRYHPGLSAWPGRSILVSHGVGFLATIRFPISRNLSSEMIPLATSSCVLL